MNHTKTKAVLRAAVIASTNAGVAQASMPAVAPSTPKAGRTHRSAPTEACATNGAVALILTATALRLANLTVLPPEPRKYSPLYFMRDRIAKNPAATAADWARYYAAAAAAQTQ